MEEINVGGTLVWYYYICKREVWLMAHQITPDQDDTNVILGRFFSEQTYNRSKKEVAFGSVKFDIVKKDRRGLVIGEVKKSSKYKESAKMQLAFYLLELHNQGIAAAGELLFPREKKKEIIELDEELINRLNQTIEDIKEIVNLPRPPAVEETRFCSKCAYHEFCRA